VFYYIARRVSTNAADLELLIYYVLLVLKPYLGKPFSIVADLTQFSEENEIQDQWINQFLKMVPYEVTLNLNCTYIYNANTAFKKYSKKLQRLVSNKNFKKLVFLNSPNEFNDYISPIELRLPKTSGNCCGDSIC
jgi:neurofibromin 1